MVIYSDRSVCILTLLLCKCITGLNLSIINHSESGIYACKVVFTSDPNEDISFCQIRVVKPTITSFTHISNVSGYDSRATTTYATAITMTEGNQCLREFNSESTVWRIITVISLSLNIVVAIISLSFALHRTRNHVKRARGKTKKRAISSLLGEKGLTPDSTASDPVYEDSPAHADGYSNTGQFPIANCNI